MLGGPRGDRGLAAGVSALAPLRFSFPRSRRVRKRGEFVRIQSGGARVNTRHFLLLLAKRADDGPSRLGVVASRKIGCAVVRNRGKRLVREAFRRSPGMIPPRFDVVIILRAGAHELGLRDVEAELRGVSAYIARTCNRLRLSSPEPAAGPG